MLSKESAGELFSQSFRERMFLLDRFIKFELERLTSGNETVFDAVHLMSAKDIAKLTLEQRQNIGIIPGRRTFQPWANANARRLAKDRIKRQIASYQKYVNGFVQKDLREIYAAGAQSVTPDAKLTPAQKASATKLAKKTNTYLSNATEQVSKNANQIRTVKAKTAKQFERQIRNVDKVMINGRRYDFGKYTELVATTEAQRIFNMGVIDEAVKKETKYFEVVDGSECGWRSHDDTEKANGKIVTAVEARANPLAHPNCVRRFIPRPELKTKREATKEQKNLQASKIEKLARQVGRVAAQAVAKQAIDIGLQLAINMAADQQFREMVFNSYENGLVNLSRFTDRIHRWRTDAAARALNIIPSEQEIIEGTSNWIEEFMKDEAQAQRNMPSYAYEILTGQKAAYLKRFKGRLPKAVGDRIMMDADEFATYVDIRSRATMTHQDLNIMNSIESEFGHQFFNSLGRTFGNRENLLETIQKLSQTFATRYAPNAGNVRTAAGWVKSDPALRSRFKTQVRGEAYRRFLKSTVDETLTHLPTMTEDGRWTVIGNVLNLNRKDLLGIKYNYASKRLIGAQLNFVDRWRYYPTGRLRGIALQKGIAPNVVMDAEGRQGLIELIRSVRQRQFIAESEVLGFKTAGLTFQAQNVAHYLASNLGMMSHITLNRNGMVRLGFQFSPYYGWRYPIPRITIQPPKSLKILGLRPKLTTTLNRGRLAGPGVRQAVAMGDLSVEGMRLRTATTELSIALGRTFVGPRNITKFLGSTVQGPGVLATGISLSTEIGHLNNWHDVKSFLANAERIGRQYFAASNKSEAILRGITAQTKILQLFAEMRTMGWRWLRLGRVVGLDALQTREIVRNTYRFLGNFSVEARLKTIETYIQDYYRGVFALTDEGLTDLIRHYVRVWEMGRFGRTSEASGGALLGGVSFDDRVRVFGESFRQIYGGRTLRRPTGV